MERFYLPDNYAVANEIAWLVLIPVANFMLVNIRDGNVGSMTNMNEATIPPQLPVPTCMAMATPLLTLPPTLLPFHMTKIGIIGYLGPH
jgi:hypothetical protein